MKIKSWLKNVSVGTVKNLIVPSVHKTRKVVVSQKQTNFLCADISLDKLKVILISFE